MEAVVKHQAIVLNWPTLNELGKPKTLVLGSFNPYQDIKNSVDYYYGRKSNHFWRTIAQIIDKNDEYFLIGNEKLKRKLAIMTDQFICMDVINEIRFQCMDNLSLNNFLNSKIFSNFSDQTIWTSKTNYNQVDISISRIYNQEIIKVIQNSTSIKKVIHTMGDNRLNKQSISPKEQGLNNLGFSYFVNTIVQLCKEKNIDFVYKSYSPSDYAIKNGKTKKGDLYDFLKHNLGF